MRTEGAISAAVSGGPSSRGAADGGVAFAGVSENTPRRFAPPLSRGDLLLLESPLVRGAQTAGCVHNFTAASVSDVNEAFAPTVTIATNAATLAPAVRAIVLRETAAQDELPFDPPHSLARAIRASYGRYIAPTPRRFHAHA